MFGFGWFEEKISFYKLTSVTFRPNVVLSTISMWLSVLHTIRSVTGVKSATVQATVLRGQGNKPSINGHRDSLRLKSCFQTPHVPRGQFPDDIFNSIVGFF